jgi:hypothetical protein
MEKIINMRTFFAIIISLASFPLHAQEKEATAGTVKSCSCGFQSVLQGGLLEGAVGPSWNLQTINGVYYKTWFAGIGAGLDYYSMRTVPLFMDFRKELFRKSRTPYLYADGGIHFAWLKNKEKPGGGPGEYNNGFYYDIGAGYKIGFRKRDALLVSAGYTMKTLREKRIVFRQCILHPCNSFVDRYNYTFSRLSFKVGWQFR